MDNETPDNETENIAKPVDNVVQFPSRKPVNLEVVGGPVNPVPPASLTAVTETVKKVVGFEFDINDLQISTDQMVRGLVAMFGVTPENSEIGHAMMLLAQSDQSTPLSLNISTYIPTQNFAA